MSRNNRNQLYFGAFFQQRCSARAAFGLHKLGHTLLLHRHQWVPLEMTHYQIPAALCPYWGMCYNRRAVERAAKQGLSSAGPQHAAASPEATPQLDSNSAAAKTNFSAVAEEVDRSAIAQQESRSAMAHQEDRSAVVREEHALLYCPVCSQRLESRRCKLICQVCGYYMSCADYY